LRDWRGEEPETFFGNLGDWAEKRIEEMIDHSDFMNAK